MLDSGSQKTGHGPVPDGPRERFVTLPAYQGSCSTIVIRVAAEKIGFVHAILESFDSMARVRTRDNKLGIMEIVYPGDWSDVVWGALRELQRHVPIEILESPAEEA